MSSVDDGELIIEKIQLLLGDEYENYKESFEVIHKTDPLSNPHKFLNHVEKYLGHSKSKRGERRVKSHLFNSQSIEKPIQTDNNVKSPKKNDFDTVSNHRDIRSYSCTDYTDNELDSEVNCNVNIKCIYNENLMRRKGCITDKSITKHFIRRFVENQEDSLWLDSDLDSYSVEFDRRVQNLIDEIIANFSELWIDECGNKYPIIPVGENRKQSIVTLGVIGCDNEGSLNEESVLLLGTRIMSSGNFCQLKLSEVKNNIFLYPGQVVAILGNTKIDELNQSCLYAKDIIGGLPPRLPETSLEEFKNIPKLYAKNGEHPVHCIIFSGPYTKNNETLNYEYLKKILNYANSEKPHALLLLGPFIDSRNEAVKKGDIFDFELNKFLTFEDIYNKIIFKYIEDFAKKNEKVRIYLVPSEYDILHPFPLPQPGIDESILKNIKNSVYKNIYFLSNPCELYINDFKIIVTSSDVVTPLFNSKITRSEDLPLEVVLSQFLYQKTLYPCFPVQHPINPKLWKNLTLDEELPHILITPFTDSPPFVKPVLGRVFINPAGKKVHSGISMFLYSPTDLQIKKVSDLCENENLGKVPLSIEDRISVDEIEWVSNI